MKKFLICMLVVCAIVVSGIGGMLFAGEKANVVVTDSAGKALVIKSVTLTSGSSTVASGLGTATHALFLPSTSSTGTTTARFYYAVSAGNVTFSAYDATGIISTSDYVGTGFIWGTP